MYKIVFKFDNIEEKEEIMQEIIDSTDSTIEQGDDFVIAMLDNPNEPLEFTLSVGLENDISNSIIVKQCSNTQTYKDRMIKEYQELKDRMDKLHIMLEKYKSNQLEFTPACSYDLLNGQFKAMDMYASYLEERALIEKIDLDKDIDLSKLSE